MEWRTWKGRLWALGLLLWGISLALWPQVAAQGAREGLTICAQQVVPALFPFLLLSTLTIQLGAAQGLGQLLRPLLFPLLGTDPVGTGAVVLGLLGGYPLGARTAVQLYQSGNCSRRECQRLLVFCNNCGPAFVLGVAGAGVLGSPLLGVALYLIHLAAALGVGALSRVFLPPHGNGEASSSKGKVPLPSLGAALPQAVKGAMESSLVISAFVTAFSVLLALLERAGGIEAGCALLSLSRLSAPSCKALLAGALEVTAGLTALTGESSRTAFVLAALLLGWGGLSVHCQVMALTEGTGLSLRPYLWGKLAHGLLSAGLAWAIYPLFSHSLSVWEPMLSPSLRSLFPSLWLSWLSALPLFFLLSQKIGGKIPRQQV